MATPQEPDFPPGHPARFDYEPQSPEAVAWAKYNMSPLGERDFPVGHPKAVDTEGNTNHVPTRAGANPEKPELEPFSGRTPAQAAGAKAMYQAMATLAKPSPVLEPIIAPAPPKNPGDTRPPSGQPDLVDVLRERIRSNG